MRDTTRDTQLNQELNGIYTDINHLSWKPVGWREGLPEDWEAMEDEE